ncbi:muscle-specific protein 300 kDa-like isoform X2 [Scylla paramamosain]|uniref:muscle-specific protein 300 kDa-like isoform X2 n=1 Tax=Scylla paramamosain TaxID=85552 RepID=UPI003083DBB2
MTFWQENYGFVKDVYDFRLQKYQEWMDNLEAIVSKVMAPNVQYTYKEFKMIQDNLASLCRDLEKEHMKEWLDLMLEKIAMRVCDEASISTKDKEFKNAEKKKLQALIDRHDKLMPSTQETQAKVDVYALCYAYGDDIYPCLKTLEEMRHLSVKEIHPHNMNMMEEQIEKAEKVISTVESQRDTYEDLLKRGKKLLLNPNKAPFITDLIEKMERTWIEANEQSKLRLAVLTNTAKDWEKYDEMRASINEPLEKLESELKRYRKYYDPVMGAKKLTQKKGVLEENKKIADEMFEGIQSCYKTIMVLAGDDKKEFLDREVSEVEEKKTVIDNCIETLTKLQDYNDALSKAVNHAKDLEDWAGPTNRKLKEITTDPDMSPENRVKEILILQEQAKEKLPQLDPLDEDYKKLLTGAPLLFHSSQFSPTHHLSHHLPFLPTPSLPHRDASVQPPLRTSQPYPTHHPTFRLPPLPIPLPITLLLVFPLGHLPPGLPCQEAGQGKLVLSEKGGLGEV